MKKTYNCEKKNVKYIAQAINKVVHISMDWKNAEKLY